MHEYQGDSQATSTQILIALKLISYLIKKSTWPTLAIEYFTSLKSNIQDLKRLCLNQL